MTDNEKQRLRQNAAVMLALADGKQIQYQRRDGEWEDTDNVSGDWLHRVKPEPQMRDWNCPEDVPGPSCWIRRAPGGWPCLVTEVADDWLVIGSCAGLRLSWREVAHAEYSTTRRKDDWHPCKVLVQ